jgi:hypothetical protein
MRNKLWFSILPLTLVLGLLAFSGRILVVNRPRPADVIIVLAGETELRPQRGLELLRSGYASQLILDVPANTKMFRWSELDLAQQYV